MKVFHKSLTFRTKGPMEFHNATEGIERLVHETNIQQGLCLVYAPHATGVLILTEDEPRLLRDLTGLMRKLAPTAGSYSHPDNAHSHLLSVLLGSHLAIPIVEGRLGLGTWQSVMFAEVDTSSRSRTLTVQVLGE